jgi:hypothetical protein
MQCRQGKESDLERMAAKSIFHENGGRAPAQKLWRRPRFMPRLPLPDSLLLATV